MEEFYEEIKNKDRKSHNRYKDCRILKDKDTGELVLESREIKKIEIRSSDQYHTVTPVDVNRLDLIASKYYKNPLLWWVIAQANDIYDPFEELTVGSLIRIPSLESLYGNNGVLL